MFELNRERLANALFPLGTQGPEGPLAAIGRRYLWSLPVVTTLGLIASALEGVSIGLLIPLLTLLLDDAAASTDVMQPFVGVLAALPASTRIFVTAGGMLLLIVFKAIVQTINAMLIDRVEGNANADVRAALSNRILHLGYPFFLANEPARLVNIVSSDSWRAAEAVRMIFSMTTAGAALLVFSGLLIFVDWRLFLFVALGVTAIRAAQALFARKLRMLGEYVSSSNRDLGEQMLLIVTSIRLIRLFGQEAKEQQRFVDASDRVRQAMYGVQKASSLMLPRLEVMQSMLFIAVLLNAHWMGIALPTVAAFLVLLYRMQPHLLSISQAHLGLASIRASVREVEWLLGPEGKPLPQGGTLPIARIDQSVRFENISFSYPGASDSSAAVKEATFSLRPGVATALIGRSGAGKSTIINLLCRLIEPTTGRILVGEARLCDIDPTAWRRQIALAGQDIDLIDGTIAENIAYGCPEASVQEIEEAARIADASSFIARLPHGFQTRVGLRGLSLSGGQRQRIGLARALLRKPDLLILDEATNAVDGLSEWTIMTLLKEHRNFGSAIVISHRRSTLAACEDGIVLEHGRVKECGPLRTLSFYREMELDSSASSQAGALRTFQ